MTAGRQTLSVAQVRALQHTFVTGLHAALGVCAVLAAVGMVTSLVRGKDSTEPMEAPLKGLDDARFALWRVAKASQKSVVS